MPQVYVGNKREVPPDVPVGAWVHEVEALVGADFTLPWYTWELEALSPDDLARVRAKAQVWFNHTRQLPEDIAVWWEVRLARRRGDLPHLTEAVEATVDDQGVTHCGRCGAKWTDAPERCKLCDRLLTYTGEGLDGNSG